MTRRRRLLRNALLAPAALTSLRSAAQTPLQLGVVPHVSARVILTNYQPLRRHLERGFDRTVEISTASSFREFHQRSMAGVYDLVVTAANLGRIAQVEGKLSAIAIYEPRIPGLLVMLKARPVTDVEEIRGRTLAVSNPQSLVALTGMRWLSEKRLRVGPDFRTVHAANDESLAQLLSSGDAPLAMMSRGEFRAIHEDLRARLEVFTEFTKVPGFMVLLGKSLSTTQVEAVRAGLADFLSTEDGRQFSTLTGTTAIRALEDADFRALDEVLDETRRLLA